MIDTRFLSRSAQRGFTLMEAIVVISITAIVGAMVAMFIRLPVQGYIDSAARADLADIADTSLRRMARDVRLALPNSIRMDATSTNQPYYLELLLTKGGGRYLAAEDEVSSGNVLAMNTQTACGTTYCSFDIVGLAPGQAFSNSNAAIARQGIVAGDSIVVYNLGPGFEPANAYDCSSSCNRAVVSPVASSSSQTVNLVASGGMTTFAAQSIALGSPTRRFQVVSGPVTYYCDSYHTSDGASVRANATGNLYRYSGYAIQATQPLSSALSSANQAILASGVDSCNFDISSLANTHTAMITLRLNLISPVNQERVTLVQQIHVDNTP
jgi:MSHA biogenesis protein MshO